MRIERVDDKTVKCFLSNEELEEYQIDYKDFVLRSEKAKQVVQDIIEQAVEEVGYRPPKFAFDMQIMMLPDQGLLLTFSEPDPANMPNAQQILDYLKEMKQNFQKLEVASGKKTESGAESKTESGVKEKAGAGESTKPGKAIFVFENIRQVMDFASVLPVNLRVKSALYEMDGTFYLYLERGGASYERYSRACIQALEYGKLYGTEEKQLLPMEEHGACLIPEKAVQKLRG